MQRRITIADLARESGVSKGTVDRVLHNRGRVSSQARTAVERAKEKLGYSPNLLAQNLKKNKVYSLFILLPDPSKDAYWSQLDAISELFHTKLNDLSIDLKIRYFDPFSQSSFKQASKELLNEDIDFLILATQFYNESMFLLQKLKKDDIPVIVFNTMIEIPSVLSFVGQDLIQSGKTAANLAEIMFPTGAGIALIHVDEHPDENGALKQKSLGVHAYFSNKAEFKVQEYLFDSNSNGSKSELFENNVWIVSNSGAHKIIKAFGQKTVYPKIIAYDLIQENIENLKNGTFQFILNQPLLKQVEISIESAINHLIFSKQIPSKQFSSIEIKTAENL